MQSNDPSRFADPISTQSQLNLQKNLKVIDKAVTAHMAREEEILKSFSANDRDNFADLLRNVLHV